MAYELRSGIVFTNICGEYLLIPNRQASEQCRTIKRLNLIGAALIETVIKKEPIEKVEKVYEILGKKTPEEAAQKVIEMAEKLYQEGYLVESTESRDDAG